MRHETGRLDTGRLDGGRQRGQIGMRKVAHAARLIVLTVALTALFGLSNPIPASAHIVGTGGSPTDYRTTVTAIQPAIPAVAITVGLGGQWVRVVNQNSNQGSVTMMVLGYRGEPFLKLAGNEVQANQLSNTAFQTGLIQAPPVPADPTAAPRWVKLTEGNSVTWTDARIAPPPSPQASGSWQLPLVVDGTPVTTLGTRERVPPPSPWPWLVVLVILTVAIASLGWRRDWHRPMAAVIMVGILAFSVHVLGTGFTPQQYGAVFGWLSAGLLAGFAIVVGIVSAVSALRRSDAAPDRAVIVGVVILLLSAADLSVLWNSQLPFPGPAVLDRVLTVIFYAVAVGLLIAGIRLVRLLKAGIAVSGSSAIDG